MQLFILMAKSINKDPEQGLKNILCVFVNQYPSSATHTAEAGFADDSGLRASGKKKKKRKTGKAVTTQNPETKRTQKPKQTS